MFLVTVIREIPIYSFIITRHPWSQIGRKGGRGGEGRGGERRDTHMYMGYDCMLHVQ